MCFRTCRLAERKDAHVLRCTAVIFWLIALAQVPVERTVSAQQMGIALPPEFEMREKAARQSMFDGDWMECLRQSCKALELLKSPKNRTSTWAFTKAQFHMCKAHVLSELGCKKHALSSYDTARDVLTNQGNVGANDPLTKARLDFIAASIHRPEFIGDDEGDPQRWRQALERCGQEMERMPPVPQLEGKQRIELARVCLFLARKSLLERGETEEREGHLQDAENYLNAAREELANAPAWQLVCDPKDPLIFRKIDEAAQAGLVNQPQQLIAKEVIQATLADWTNWRMAQAELQAEKQEEDPNLGWGFDRASIEFDQMINFLAAQYGGDDHPVVFKTRITRAKWYLAMAKRDIRRNFLKQLPANRLRPDEQALKDQSYRRFQSYLADALDEISELQTLEKATDLTKKSCVMLEKEVLEVRLDGDNYAKTVVDLLEGEKRSEKDKERDKNRIAEIAGLIRARKFENDANSKVSHIGCPLLPPGLVIELVVAPEAASAKLSWKTPAVNGGSAVLGFEIEYSDDGGDSWKKAPSVRTSMGEIGSLRRGKYVFRVAAKNAAGVGPWALTKTIVIPPNQQK